jgi:pimeloyl-ACP methyl ester carboxylesterase
MRQLGSSAFGAAMLVIATAASPAPAAQTAASIEFETIARPAALPDDFTALPGTALQFMKIKTIDGFPVEAAYWLPDGGQPAPTTLVVMVHGSGDNYHNAPNFTLGAGLAAKGYAALAINTRQRDDNVNTDNFLDIRRDIEGAVSTARALGYRSLVLQGHSLGNIQVQYYAATNWDPDIKAVILLAPFGNLPWKSRNLLVQNEQNFAALTAAAMQSLKDGKLGEYMPVKMRWFTGQEVPMTGQHFLTYRWGETSVADGTFWIHRIPHPILIVRDQADGVIQPFEPYQLLSAAHAEGSLVSSITYVPLPDPDRPPSLEGHSFVGNGDRLIDAVAAWLAEQHL